MLDKDADAFRTISEVAEELDLPQHVLRFWETRFTQIKPLKRGGGRRYYRPDDVDLVRSIRHLLYGEGYTIKGVQRILKEQGVRSLISLARGEKAALLVETADESVSPQSRLAPAAGAAERGGFADAGSPPFPARAPAGLTGDQIDKLRAVLAELEECGRLLAASEPL